MKIKVMVLIMSMCICSLHCMHELADARTTKEERVRKVLVAFSLRFAQRQAQRQNQRLQNRRRFSLGHSGPVFEDEEMQHEAAGENRSPNV